MMKKTKKDLSARLQILIEVYALDISLGNKTIDDTPNHKTFRELVLQECRAGYHCDGYGKPIEKNQEEN